MDTDPRWHAIWASIQAERPTRDRLTLELARYFYNFGCRDVCVSLPDFPYKTNPVCRADVSGSYYGNQWFGIVGTAESIECPETAERIRKLGETGMVIMAVPKGCCDAARASIRSNRLDVVEVREY